MNISNERVVQKNKAGINASGTVHKRFQTVSVLGLSLLDIFFNINCIQALKKAPVKAQYNARGMSENPGFKIINIPMNPINEKIICFFVGVSFKNIIEPRIIRSGVIKDIDTTSDKETDLKAKKKEVNANIFKKALKR
jgi:hypothetical protein